ncbi:MAG TPA: hypothetical protein VE957_10490 [Terriglobales bacterium]|nr:hypothetical protein [Terriglobales bacterium]
MRPPSKKRRIRSQFVARDFHGNGEIFPAARDASAKVLLKCGGVLHSQFKQREITG